MVYNGENNFLSVHLEHIKMVVYVWFQEHIIYKLLLMCLSVSNVRLDLYNLKYL